MDESQAGRLAQLFEREAYGAQCRVAYVFGTGRYAVITQWVRDMAWREPNICETAEYAVIWLQVYAGRQADKLGGNADTLVRKAMEG